MWRPHRLRPEEASLHLGPYYSVVALQHPLSCHALRFAASRGHPNAPHVEIEFCGARGVSPAERVWPVWVALCWQVAALRLWGHRGAALLAGLPARGQRDGVDADRATYTRAAEAQGPEMLHVSLGWERKGTGKAAGRADARPSCRAGGSRTHGSSWACVERTLMGSRPLSRPLSAH